MYQVYICDDEQEVLLQLSEKIKIELERLALEADYTLVILSYLEKNQTERSAVSTDTEQCRCHCLHRSWHSIRQSTCTWHQLWVLYCTALRMFSGESA